MKESKLTKFRGEKIGFTFQAYNLVPCLSVQENVEMQDGQIRQIINDRQGIMSFADFRN